MSTHCKLIPDADNGKPSILYQKLRTWIGDHNVLKQIYCALTSNTFINKYKNQLVFDSNNEPTIDSVISFLNNDSILNTTTQRQQIEKELIVNTNTSVLSKIDQAIKYNAKNTHFVALVEDVDGKSTIRVYERNEKTNAQAEHLQQAMNVYNTINTLLQAHGININILEAGLLHGEDGLMVPEALNNTIDGFIGVINIANNIAGFNALTEEFAHFVIENIKDNPIIQRAEQLLQNNNDLVREILGDDYDFVVDYYTKSNKSHLIQREALGRLVAQMINDNIVENAVNSSVLQRAKNAVLGFIHRVFSTFTNKEIQSIHDLKNMLSGVVNDTINDNIIDNNTLEHFRKYGETLAHTTTTNDLLQTKINRTRDVVLANLAKYLNVYAPEYENALETTKRMDTQYNQAVEQLQGTTMLAGINSFINETLDILRTNQIGLQNLSTQYVGFGKLCKNANAVTQVKNVIMCYSEPIDQIAVLCRDLMNAHKDNPENEVYKLANETAAVVEQVQRIIFETKKDIDDIRLTLLRQAFAPFFNENETIELTIVGNEKRIVTLTEILEESMGDISWFDRMLNSAQETNDLFIQVVDRFIQKQKEFIRGKAIEFDHRIVALDKKYRAMTGSSDTSFMHVFSPNGKKTGYYISDRDYVAYNAAYNREYARLQNLHKDKPNAKELIEEGIKQWEAENTEDFIIVRKLTNKSKKNQTEPPKRIYRVPRKDLYSSNAINNLNAAQKMYYDEFMALREELCWLLPQGATEPHLAIQMRMRSIGEAVVTSKTGLMNGLLHGFKTISSRYFSNALDYDEYGNTTNKPLWERIQTKLNSREESAVSINTFDKTPYKRIPMYFVKKLADKDMEDLSIDSTTALREFNIMAQNYSGMHRMVDVIDLIKEQNKARKIYKGSLKKRVNEIIKRKNYESAMPQEYYTQATNIFKRVEALIDMQFYSILKNQGVHLTDSLTTAKLCDDLIKYTSFSILGYNGFSALNNFFNGKYQMFIETTSGEYFNWKDYLKAAKQYWTELLPKFIAQYHTPYNNSELALWFELTNTGQNWKNKIREQQSNKGKLRQLTGEFDSGFMLEMGETNMQAITMLSFINHYKLYKNPVQYNNNGKIINTEFVTLKDAVKRVPTIVDGVEIDAHLELKPEYQGWFTEQGDKFDLSIGSGTMMNISWLIGKLNDEMHGIFNIENSPEAQMYSIGRLALVYRKHIVPQFQKRWKTLGKGYGKYSFVTHQQEEGYYVTSLRTAFSIICNKHAISQSKEQNLLTAFLSFNDWGTAMALAYKALTPHQRANLRRTRMEAGLMAAITLLSIFVFGGFDDDDNDEWAMRHAYYQMRRLQLEAFTYIRPVSNGMQILISPTAVLSPLQHFGDFFRNIPNYDQILKSGPYKGHSRLYAATMRMLPVYSQIKDFVQIDRDNHRFNFFQKSMVENLIEKLEEDNEE